MKVFSILNVVFPALQELKKSDAGRIVIVNGVTANKPDLNMAAVSAARAAVKQIFHMLAISLAPNVLVNCVNIGAIATDRQKDRYGKAKTNLLYSEWEKKEAERRGILLGRYGRPEEVLPFIGLLLSPLSSYITSSSIDISGGLDAKRRVHPGTGCAVTHGHCECPLSISCRGMSRSVQGVVPF
jgi:NAD(P)-dependent dehydrogenase (short-subunit alcohol dehydrogenase family)